MAVHSARERSCPAFSLEPHTQEDPPVAQALIRQGIIATVAAAVLGGGAWALAAAPGMPAAAPTPAPSDTRLQAAETAVLDGANAQGSQEIQALQAAKHALTTLQTQLQAQTRAAARYRTAALQATLRARQLAAQLQAAQTPRYRGDDGGYRRSRDH